MDIKMSPAEFKELMEMVKSGMTPTPNLHLEHKIEILQFRVAGMEQQINKIVEGRP